MLEIARFVVVAAVPVAFRKEKFWRVEEPDARRFVKEPVVEKNRVVVAVVPVALRKLKF